MRQHTVAIVIAVVAVIYVAVTLATPTPLPIPKQIWTYWDDASRLPRTVQMCMDGWRKHNSDYRITLLTRDNYADYTEIPRALVDHANFHDNPTRFSDLVRIWTLAQHGGIWIDSSVLVKQPLDQWLAPPGGVPAPEFIGYYIDGMTSVAPVIENWFYAAPPASPFVCAWRDEFARIADFPTVSDYVDHCRAEVDISKIIAPDYLAQHVAAQMVLQRRGGDRLFLRRAEDGPFRYLVASNWDSKAALHAACSNLALQSPIMKMRGVERGVLEAALDGELSAERCGWRD